MNDIQLVLVDIDGTLLNDQGIVTPKTNEAIKKLKDKHILFGIATGRTPFAVKHLIKNWGIEPYVDVIMGFNGGCYLDMRTQKMSSCYLLDGKYIPVILEAFQEFDFNAGIYDQESFHVLKEDSFAKEIAKKNQLPLVVDGLTPYYHKQIEKMILMAENEEIQKIRQHYNHIDHPHYRGVQSTPILFEFLNPELSKSKGIEKMCHDFNLSTDCILTFGDELNDYEMIRDYIGVAMGNANPQIKEVAQYVTTSNNEDGIAMFLENFIL